MRAYLWHNSTGLFELSSTHNLGLIDSAVVEKEAHTHTVCWLLDGLSSVMLMISQRAGTCELIIVNPHQQAGRRHQTSFCQIYLVRQEARLVASSANAK